MDSPSRNPITHALNRTGTTLLSPPLGGFGYYRNPGPRDARKIALTFDDGPSEPCTTALLDAMGELDVKGTLFCVGVNAQWHPEVVARAMMFTTQPRIRIGQTSRSR